MSLETSDVTVEPGTSPLNVTVGNFPATQPVNGTVTGNQGTPTTLANGWPVELTDGSNVLGTPAHPLTTTGTPVTSSTSTVVQITSTAANQVLLAANASRKKAILFFSSGSWSVKFGATASSTSFTYNISSANTTLEVTIWTGEIDAICTTSGKLVNVTELV